MKIVFKIAVDILMMTMFLFLMFGYDLSPLYHEILGIAIGLAFAIHIVLNLKATKGLLKSLEQGKFKKSKKLNAILDLVLLGLMPLNIISGLAVSKFLIATDYVEIIVKVHNLLSWVVLVVIFGHLGTHLNYLKAVIKAKFATDPNSRLNMVSLAGLIVVIGGLLFNSFIMVVNFSNLEGTTAGDSNDDGDTATEGNYENYDESTKKADDQSDGTTETISLDDYLAGLNCDGCGRNCSLANPKCGVGVNQAQQATLEYENLYGQGESQSETLVVATINNQQKKKQFHTMVRV